MLQDREEYFYAFVLPVEHHPISSVTAVCACIHDCLCESEWQQHCSLSVAIRRGAESDGKAGKHMSGVKRPCSSPQITCCCLKLTVCFPVETVCAYSTTTFCDVSVCFGAETSRSRKELDKCQ